MEPTHGSQTAARERAMNESVQVENSPLTKGGTTFPMAEEAGAAFTVHPSYLHLASISDAYWEPKCTAGPRDGRTLIALIDLLKY